MTDTNQNPEQLARDEIDARLEKSGWRVQGNRAIDFNAALGVAVKEYQTSIGPADYVLCSDKTALGVVEAKPDSWGQRITTVETQSAGYSAAELKWVKNPEGRDPKPRSREVFSFHRPETLSEWLKQPHE